MVVSWCDWSIAEISTTGLLTAKQYPLKSSTFFLFGLQIKALQRCEAFFRFKLMFTVYILYSGKYKKTLDTQVTWSNDLNHIMNLPLRVIQLNLDLGKFCLLKRMILKLKLWKEKSNSKETKVDNGLIIAWHLQSIKKKGPQLRALSLLFFKFSLLDDGEFFRNFYFSYF